MLNFLETAMAALAAPVSCLPRRKGAGAAGGAVGGVLGPEKVASGQGKKQLQACLPLAPNKGRVLFAVRRVGSEITPDLPPSRRPAAPRCRRSRCP